MKKLFLLLCFICSFANAETINIKSANGEVPTAYWEKTNSKAVMIFIPGGDGSFGVASRNPPKPSWFMLNLFNLDTSPDIVYMDSNTSLGWKDISPRYSAEHIENITAVVKYYKERTKKPVYLIGHSNGSISIAEFLNKSSDSQRLVAGIILSAGRNETSIDVKLSIPTLVMVHEQDSNVWTTPSASVSLYEKIKATNSKAKLAFIHGGYNEMGNPATGGRHMYAGSLNEVATTLNEFLSSSLSNNIK